MLHFKVMEVFHAIHQISENNPQRNDNNEVSWHIVAIAYAKKLRMDHNFIPSLFMGDQCL